MAPSEAWMMAVLYQGRVYVLGILDGRVVNAIPVIATSGTATIPEVEPWTG